MPVEKQLCGQPECECCAEAGNLLRRIAELEATVLAAKTLLHPTTDHTEEAWQVLDDAYHRRNARK